jgi:hypothetical protein
VEYDDEKIVFPVPSLLVLLRLRFLESLVKASSMVVLRLGPDFAGGGLDFTISAQSDFLKPPFAKQGMSQSQIAQRLFPSLRPRVIFLKTAIVLKECRIEFIQVCSPRV